MHKMADSEIICCLHTGDDYIKMGYTCKIISRAAVMVFNPVKIFLLVFNLILHHLFP